MASPRGEHLKPHHFKKGVSGNPEGRPPLTPEQKALRNLTEAEMVEIGSLVVKGNIAELKKLMKNPKTTVLKAMMAAVAVKTIQSGNPSALDTLLNRLVGKVKDVVEVNSNNKNLNANLNAEVSEEQIKTAIEKLEKDV